MFRQDMKLFEVWMILLLSWCTAPCIVAASSPLRAGIAVVEITPPVGSELVGFEQPRRAEKIHDSLSAKVLVLRTGDSSLTMVAADLYRLQSPPLVDRIRHELRIDHTILSASHTHAAPSLDPNTRSSAWGQDVEEKIFQAVKQANENLFSAEILWGQGALIGAHNTRVFQDDGTVRDRWSNPKEEGTAPIDPAVRVIRIDQAGGGTKAVLVHYSCEPAILGPKNRDISADFPGAVVRHVEKELGRNVTCFFLLGASADIYPFRPLLSGQEAFTEVENMGQRLGREAVRVARNLSSTNSDNQELIVKETVLAFANRWDHTKQYEVGLSTVLVNKGLALMAVPAEMFLEFQLLLKAKSPVPMTLLLGSSYTAANSWGGTIPTIVQAAEGGFGASYATDIEVGAGETIIDQGVIQLYRILGKLDELPRGVLVYEMPDLPSP
jgi:hypothetical protein